MSPLALMLAAAALAGDATADLQVCPGESGRYGDHKCNHDETHRFCAQLLDAGGQPLSWGPKGDFWSITGQKAFQWDADIRANKGDSWCICMWAAARLIAEVGCENVHLHCEATDVAYIEQQYSDGGVDLLPAKQCMRQRCPAGGLVQRSDAAVPQVAAGRAAARVQPRQSVLRVTAPAAVALSLTMAGVLVWRMRSPRASGPGEGGDGAAPEGLE
mmetsp:Transcript_41006/g.113979  ORF Transcript_41006/g.113979 Transcript_41006/m.113979 type:complete len:216 (-) Transcript_41006:137-784(-)